MKNALIYTISVIFSVCSGSIFADYKQDIGYSNLIAELGGSTPTGLGITVNHVEAATSLVDHDNDGTADIPVYWPDYNSSDLVSDFITDITGAKSFLESYGISTFSSHATGVAVHFYGSNSIAPGINNVYVYWADHWLGSGALDPIAGGNDLPVAMSSRISNHSYIGDINPVDYSLVADTLRRVDWLIDTDEQLQVTGLINNAQSNGEIYSNSFNVIRVGKSDGINGMGTSDIDSIYTSGRTGIDVVVDVATSSTATPIVAAASALLIEVGHNNPSLSTDLAAISTSNRVGNTIYNAERSEVIKAALLAGASRVTQNTEGAADISDYRDIAANQTNNGLDIRYGAGQLNIYNSYHILNAGEQNSVEDGGPGATGISNTGFDYDPSFGGLNNSNTVASYNFSTGNTPTVLTVSLAWNINIDEGPSPATFLGNATFYDLDLYVYDLTYGQVLIANSVSDKDNSENIWVNLPANRNYMIQVEPKSGQSAFDWDYALAWQIDALPSSTAVEVPISFLGMAFTGLLLSIIGIIKYPGKI